MSFFNQSWQRPAMNFQDRARPSLLSNWRGGMPKMGGMPMMQKADYMPEAEHRPAWGQAPQQPMQPPMQQPEMSIMPVEQPQTMPSFFSQGAQQRDYLRRDFGGGNRRTGPTTYFGGNS